MNTKAYKKNVVDKLSDVLKSRGFKRKGNWYHLSNGDLTYYIGVQSSLSSTADLLKITVNIEIASSIISKLDDTSMPIEYQRHYVSRIGDYLESGQDKWWIVSDINLAEIVANEIAEIIISKVIPHFDTLKSTEDLAALWRGVGHMGVTEGQRRKYLNLLDNR